MHLAFTAIFDNYAWVQTIIIKTGVGLVVIYYDWDQVTLLFITSIINARIKNQRSKF